MGSTLLTKHYSVINTPITNVNFDDQEIIDNTKMIESVFSCGTMVRTLNGGKVSEKKVDYLNDTDIISMDGQLYKVVNVFEDYK